MHATNLVLILWPIVNKGLDQSPPRTTHYSEYRAYSYHILKTK